MCRSDSRAAWASLPLMHMCARIKGPRHARLACATISLFPTEDAKVTMMSGSWTTKGCAVSGLKLSAVQTESMRAQSTRAAN